MSTFLLTPYPSQLPLTISLPVSVRPDRSATPPPSNSRLGISLEPSAFSSTISTVTSPAIVAPKPFHPHPSEPNVRHPQQSRGAPSAPSPPLDPTVSHPRSLSQNVPVSSAPEVSIEFYVDDESLSSVEKIYLFCRSQITMHRFVVCLTRLSLPTNLAQSLHLSFSSYVSSRCLTIRRCRICPTSSECSRR